MARFRFRPATLLRLREATRDERRASLAEAYRAAEILDERGREVDVALAQLLEQYRRAAQPGTLDVDRLISAQRHEAIVRLEQQEIARQKQLLRDEIERRRAALVAADRDVHVLEKLRERQFERFEADEARAEVKQLDEFAVQRGGKEASSWDA